MDVRVARIVVKNPAPGGASSALTLTIDYPLPFITGLSSKSAVAGSSGFTLSVSGGNFVATAKVLWSGGALATTFVSATELTATVPASDISEAGTAAITVTSPAPGGGTSG